MCVLTLSQIRYQFSVVRSELTANMHLDASHTLHLDIYMFMYIVCIGAFMFCVSDSHAIKLSDLL